MKMPSEAQIKGLYEAILTLKTEAEVKAFIEDLCTIQEIGAMAQRLQVAKMLTDSHIYHEIERVTGASSATISRVNKYLQHGADGYKTVFSRVRKGETT